MSVSVRRDPGGSVPHLRPRLAAAVAAVLLLGAQSTASGSVYAAGVEDPGDDQGNNKTGDLELLTATLPSLLPGQEGWVSLVWAAGTDVCEVRVTAKTKALGATYPANTATYSSFYVNDALAEGNLDFTAFRLAAPAVSGSYEIEFVATYTRLKDSAALLKTDDLVTKDVRGSDCAGNAGRVTQTIAVPVAWEAGAPLQLQDQPISLSVADGPVWADLAFTSNSPDLEGFRVSVTPPPGVDVAYPAGGTFSGLRNGSGLATGATDVAAIQLDAEGAVPGSYPLQVTATWSGGSWTGEITVEVGP
jgi:hypothetical protein